MNATTAQPTIEADIDRIFQLQKAHQFQIANATARDRIAKLRKLHEAVLRYRTDFKGALSRDFQKHPSEVDITEILPVTSEIKHAKNNLRRWMSPQKAPTPFSLFGGRSWIQYEPKGVVLIISPWNFPLNLTFGPLVSAIAAGNCVFLKPSEHTPNAAALMKKIIGEIFDEKEVVLFEGDAVVSQTLLKLPFNHIYFTGAPAIGKIVMEAAAKHLASVTLELGGKSPTIIDETANLSAAAARTAWGKFVNTGQVCLAPDYVFVHETKKEEFVELVRQKIKEFYGDEVAGSANYCRMVNNRHFARVKGYVDEAVAKGAKIEVGGKFDGGQDYIEPTLVSNVDRNSRLMQEEIFGPVLPVITFKNLQEPIDFVNSGEKPLALYIFSKSRKNIKRILKNTRAGGSCINQNVVHYNNLHLPFGGSNNSGIGKGHGRFGFEAFSNARAIYQQVLPSAVDLLMPPYNNFKQKLIDWTIRWL